MEFYIEELKRGFEEIPFNRIFDKKGFLKSDEQNTVFILIHANRIVRQLWHTSRPFHCTCKSGAGVKIFDFPLIH